MSVRGIGIRSAGPDFLDPDIEAACADADPEVFFPEGSSHELAAALAEDRYCRPCPYYRRCRQWALAQTEDLYGIWAGTTKEQRRHLRRTRPRALVTP
ncbi:WhiB family transcriptional regulator [Micromonospora sp. NPDC047670]|uniref:WhiB family transcriptional regulator n=1 Tax=Micromonospora sp. NPDC047670 TaxID=3364252 RepID=UPI00371C85BF